MSSTCLTRLTRVPVTSHLLCLGPLRGKYPPQPTFSLSSGSGENSFPPWGSKHVPSLLTLRPGMGHTCYPSPWHKSPCFTFTSP